MLAACGAKERFEELVAVSRIQKRIVKRDLGDPRHAALEQIFQARLCRGGHGNGVTVATQSRR